jgi:hypothetical protein
LRDPSMNQDIIRGNECDPPRRQTYEVIINDSKGNEGKLRSEL